MVNKKNYTSPLMETVDINLEAGVLTGNSIKQTTTPSNYPDLEVGGETTTADSRRKDIWTDPEEEEEENF